MVTPAEIAEKFPEFNAYASVPELQNLFTLAATTNMSDSAFKLALWDTNWWKTQSSTQREWQKMTLTDPASAKEKSGQMGSTVNATALGLGYHLTPAEVTWFTELSLQHGWDASELARQITSGVSQKRIQAGTIDSTRDQLQATAAEYGVNMGDKTLMDWATNIATGRQTTEGFQDYAKYHAGVAYPQLKAQLDAGQTVRQIADPYLQTASQLLGMDPNQMRLTEPKWQTALQGRDAQGKVIGPMSMLDWQRKVMSDHAYGWDNSANGKQSALQMRDSLGKVFGVTT